MFEQKAPKLTGVDHPFSNADEKSLDVSRFRVSRTTTNGLLGFSLGNERPVKKREKETIVSNNGIIGDQALHRGLVKNGRRGYHRSELLLQVE
jgi:hypothetical protein